MAWLRAAVMLDLLELSCDLLLHQKLEMFDSDFLPVKPFHACWSSVLRDAAPGRTVNTFTLLHT